MYIKKNNYKKNKKIMLTVFLGIYSLIFITALFAPKVDQNIVLSDYSTTTFKGYDGTASNDTIQLDTDKLLSDYPKLKSKWNDENLEYRIENNYVNGKLKNGDNPCYNYTISNENELIGFNFDKRVCFEVTGLISKEEFDRQEKERIINEAKEKAEKDRIAREEAIKQKEEAIKLKEQEEKDNADSESQNALSTAQRYVDIMAFSKK